MTTYNALPATTTAHPAAVGIPVPDMDAYAAAWIAHCLPGGDAAAVDSPAYQYAVDMLARYDSYTRAAMDNVHPAHVPAGRHYTDSHAAALSAIPAAKRAARRAAIVARAACTHSPAPAVICPPLSMRTRIASMLETDIIQGRHSGATGVVRIDYDTPAHDVLVYPAAVYVPGDNGTSVAVQPQGAPRLAHCPAKSVHAVDTVPYSRPATPYKGSTAAACPKSYHPGIDAAAPVSAPAPLYSSSYAAQHSAAAPMSTPLMDIAGAIACNVVKRQYTDTAHSKFQALLWDNTADYIAAQAAAGMPDLLDRVQDAAADYAAALDAAKHDCKVLGLSGHVRARYIADATAHEKAALAAAKAAVQAAEKVCAATYTDFADIKTAAYTAGLELLTQFARWTAKKGGTAPENVDCDELITALVARNNAEKQDLTAARAAKDAAADAARKAGYKRLMDCPAYRDAKAALAKYRRRNLIITMSSAARKYVGGCDHGGQMVYADIDAAARRAKDVQSAENAALYKALDNAAVYDQHYTAAKLDLLNIVTDTQPRAVLSLYMDGWIMADIITAMRRLYPAEKWYLSKVYRLLSAARAVIATSEGYCDTVQCRAYLDAIRAAADAAAAK